MMFFGLPQPAALGLAPWWSSAMSSDLGWRCAVMAGVGVVVLAMATRAWWVLAWSAAGRGGSGSGRRRLKDMLLAGRESFRERGESGTATVEFVLVFVPALAVCLTLLQTVFVFSGNLFVHYAAFAATRSAIVEAPRGELGGGGYLADDNDPAFDRAQRAAAFALAPVSGRLSTADGGDPAAFEAGLASYFRSYGQSPPAWVNSLAGQRLAYAQAHTDLELYFTNVTDAGNAQLTKLTDPSGSNRVDFGPKDPVTLGVRHSLHLSIPYASAIFADGTHATVGGDTAYTIVTATCTMTLEGYDVNLPPLPTVRREQ